MRDKVEEVDADSGSGSGSDNMEYLRLRDEAMKEADDFVQNHGRFPSTDEAEENDEGGSQQDQSGEESEEVSAFADDPQDRKRARENEKK